MNHFFNIYIAKEFGIEEAILFNNIYYWIEKNRANEKHFHNEKYWTYSTKKAFREYFPYLTERKIGYALKNLLDNGLIEKGDFNEKSFDNTSWFAITDKGYYVLQNCNTDLTKLSDGDDKNVRPIPNINTYNNTNNIERNYNKEISTSSETDYVDKNNCSSDINDNNISNNTSDVDKNYASNKIHFNSPNDNCIPTNDCNVDKNYITEEKEKIKETNCSNDTNLGNKEKKKEKMTEIQEIFDFYQSLNVKKSRTLNENTIKLIKEKLKVYGKEKLKILLKRFAMVVNDSLFFYSYKWDLETLLKRKKGIEYFDNDGEKWLDYTSRRPTIKTTKAFEMLWNIYPNKNSKDKAREEYDKFFIGITSIDEARDIATMIYTKAKEYIYETDDQYVKNLNNFLRQIAQK